MKLAVGQTATRTLSVTAEHVELYAQITGDRNPLHFDEAFAAGTKFGRLVVHGGITAGILNALVAEDASPPREALPHEIVPETFSAEARKAEEDD